jgi:hypothetical protein
MPKPIAQPPSERALFHARRLLNVTEPALARAPEETRRALEKAVESRAKRMDRHLQRSAGRVDYKRLAAGDNDE